MNNKERQVQSRDVHGGDGIIMRELPFCQQPYEKCRQYGPECLSDAELLSVIIRTGSHGERAVDLAGHVLRALPGKCLGGLFPVSQEQLQEIHGIGRVKAIQLKCLAECSRRMLRSQMPPNELCCDDPERIAGYYMQQMRFLETEQVRLLILNGKNMLMREVIVSNGTFNSSMASPREIFYYALKHKAVNIVLLHNHPSGDPSPSREDMAATRRIFQCGRMIGTMLLDHIIIGDNRFVSFKQCGYLHENL